MKKNDRRVYLMKVFAVWGTMIGLLLAIGALRTTAPRSSPTTNANPTLAKPRNPPKRLGDSPNPSSTRRDYIKISSWPEGMRIYRDWWNKKQAAVYIVEMDRAAENLRFGVELSNSQILGREAISSMASRLEQQGIPMFAGVNGSFGIRSSASTSLALTCQNCH